MLDAVKVTRFSGVEVTCRSAQSNSFEFECQPGAKEDAGVAPEDITYIFTLVRTQ
jgi:hypothetical protein